MTIIVHFGWKLFKNIHHVTSRTRILKQYFQINFRCRETINSEFDEESQSEKDQSFGKYSNIGEN